MNYDVRSEIIAPEPRRLLASLRNVSGLRLRLGLTTGSALYLRRHGGQRLLIFWHWGAPRLGPPVEWIPTITYMRVYPLDVAPTSAPQRGTSTPITVRIH